MSRSRATIRRFAVSIVLIVYLVPVRAAEPAPLAKDWSLDVIRLKNGNVLKGMILEETATGVRFKNVHRAIGRPTVCLTTTVLRGQIQGIDKLTNDERELLKGRLNELDPSGEGERKRMESLELKVCDWNGKQRGGVGAIGRQVTGDHRGSAHRYDSDYFSLVSNAPEEVVRRSAVRLEMIYQAYENLLPPRYPGGKATTINLYHSVEEYQKMLTDRGWTLQNQAFFNPDSNRIVCGSNLKTLGEDLESVRQQNQEQRTELDKLESFFRRVFGKNPKDLKDFTKYMQQFVIPNRKRLVESDKYNDAVFDNATKRLYAILYHESFHAYVSNFVFPPVAKDGRPGELPRWLNEGLAQIFETAIVEAGELRVGHADKDRLLRVKEAVQKNEFMPLKELLNSGPKAFLVLHREDRLGSDRAYLASWALAAYLSFDRRVLGSNQLDVFVREVQRGGDAEEAFAVMTGQKTTQFEKDFHGWLLKLPNEGSMIDPVAIKDR